MRICIFGAASVYIDQSYKDKVEDLSYRLACDGHSLIFGAGAGGLMGAAACGFRRGGGAIHGVIPEFFRDDAVEPIYEHCTELTFTETMAERKKTMEDNADAFIVVPGGVGTFEEFFEVLTLKQLGRHNKPIAIYNIDGYYDELEKFLHVAMERRFITFVCCELYSLISDVDGVIAYLDNYVPSETPWQRLKRGD